MNRINDFQIDPALLAYTGKSPLQVYVKRKKPNPDNGRTTYSIKPIRAETRLFRWLQENSTFFNSIITFFLSIGIKKNDRCTILQDYKINPKNSIAENFNELIAKITKSNPHVRVKKILNGAIRGVVSNSEISESRKLEIIMGTLSTKHQGTILQKLKKYPTIEFGVLNQIVNKTPSTDPLYKMAYAKLQETIKFELVYGSCHVKIYLPMVKRATRDGS